MRKIDKDMLALNVKEYKKEKIRKEQEEKDRKYNEELLKIEKFLNNIQERMIEESLMGKEKYEITIANPEFVDTIIRYYKELGFDVNLKVEPVFNSFIPEISMFNFYDLGYKYKIVISWS